MDYARARAALFSPERRNDGITRGVPSPGSCTVSFQTADAQGNAVSFVNSNYQNFGTGLVPEGCGFTLQNRGNNFALGPEDHPNLLAPGKRPYHTIIPAMAVHEDTGELFASLTNMGGFMQPQGHVQLLVNMLDYNMDPQEAVDAPRFCIHATAAQSAAFTMEAGADPSRMPERDVVQHVSIEPGVDEAVVEELRAMGHPVNIVTGGDRALFGRAQIIRRLPSGVYAGGSDHRADGSAVGF